MAAKAGRSTRDLEFKRYMMRAGLTMLCLLLLWGCIGLLQGTSTIVGVVVVFVLIKAIDEVGGSWIKQVKHKEKRAARGAVGEETIGAILDALDSSLYQVFHDVRCPQGNIDHVVLTRGGAVVVVETKSHNGRVTADGRTLLLNGRPFPEKDFIRQTLSNSLWLGGHLKTYAQQDIWVNGVVCFSRAFVDVRQPIKGIRVTYAKNLQNTLDKSRKIDHLADWFWEHFAEILGQPTL